MARIGIDARKIHDYGIGTYIQTLVRGLARLDSDDEIVLFLTPQEPPPVRSERFSTARTGARNYGLLEHVALPWQARQQRLDLYHSPHYVLPWLTRPPAVVTIHDIIHLRFPEYLPSRGAHTYARTIMRRSFERAARVLTVSEATKADLLGTFGGPDDRVTVIPNTVDESFFAPHTEDELARVRERWRLEGRFILYAGNVKPHKNLERLIRAFAELAAEAGAGDVRLVLLGNYLASYHGLRRLAAELRVVERVRFLSWLPPEELAIVYRLATAFAYPSLYEGFGLPPLEAMASGVPVVASNTSSLPEVCGDAALLVSPTDVEGLAAALRVALFDSARRAELIRRGHERAATYRARDLAADVLRVYRDVLGSGS